MKSNYPLNKFTIRYNPEKKYFFMYNSEDILVGEDMSGRELGRDAWECGADEVCYDYDLNLDERISLIPYHEKNKR